MYHSEVLRQTKYFHSKSSKIRGTLFAKRNSCLKIYFLVCRRFIITHMYQKYNRFLDNYFCNKLSFGIKKVCSRATHRKMYSSLPQRKFYSLVIKCTKTECTFLPKAKTTLDTRIALFTCVASLL